MIDETTVATALREIPADVSGDLASRVRRSGHRRLLRRRTAVAGGAVVAAAAVPVGYWSWPSTSLFGSPTAAGHGRGTSGLYAEPPAAGSQCNGGHSAGVDRAGHGFAGTYPQLLFLPKDQAVHYALVHMVRPACTPPHVALTAMQQRGDTVIRGLVVQGPNAPTAAEAGVAGATVGFDGQSGHRRIDGQNATEQTIRQNGHTEAYWTEPNGGQWHAAVHGMSQSAAVQLLDHVRLDAKSGTASLDPAVSDSWTIAPGAADAPATNGWFTAEWTDPQGHKAELAITQTPDRLDQLAAGSYVDRSFASVRGHRAIYSAVGGLGGGVPVLTWQEAADVQIELTIVGGTLDEVKHVAASLQQTDPNDPRIR